MSKQYNDYLQSEEWKELRKKACIRASYKCEFCGADYEAVHHVEYPKNLKDDVLENLVVVCKVCHDKLHGIRKDKNIPKLPKVYMIGKISENKWRNEIFRNIDNYEYDYVDNIESLDITNNFSYGGPVFIESKGSHGNRSESHDISLGEDFSSDYDENFLKIYCGNTPAKSHDYCGLERSFIFSKCMDWLEDSDVCFAYIDSHDCYGSIVEIILALERGKKIYIYFKTNKLKEEMWFMCIYKWEKSNTEIGVYNTPIKAWEHFVSNYN